VSGVVEHTPAGMQDLTGFCARSKEGPAPDHAGSDHSMSLVGPWGGVLSGGDGGRFQVPLVTSAISRCHWARDSRPVLGLAASTAPVANGPPTGNRVLGFAERFRRRISCFRGLALARKVRALKRVCPKAADFEQALFSRKLLDPAKEASKYPSQQQHWIGWLSEYGGPGYYGRCSQTVDQSGPWRQRGDLLPAGC